MVFGFKMLDFVTMEYKTEPLLLCLEYRNLMQAEKHFVQIFCCQFCCLHWLFGQFEIGTWEEFKHDKK